MKSNLFNKAPGSIFIGCMFIGIAIGMYYNEVAIGTLAGIGVGFIARALISIKNEQGTDKKTIKL